MADRILYCLNLDLSMPFRVGSGSPVSCLFATTVNNNFQLSPIFCHKELHLRCCIGLDHMFQPLRCPKKPGKCILRDLYMLRISLINFAIFQHILCKICNSSYVIKAPKVEGYFIFWCSNCNGYWNFYKKLKIWTYFPQNRRMGENLSK